MFDISGKSVRKSGQKNILFVQNWNLETLFLFNIWIHILICSFILINDPLVISFDFFEYPVFIRVCDNKGNAETFIDFWA